MSSWVREFAEKCERDDSFEPSVDIWERWFKEVIEETARRVRDTDEVCETGIRSYYAQLGDAAATREACAQAIESMLVDADLQTKGGAR